MRILLILFGLICLKNSYAQSKEQDSLARDLNMGWLEQKLAYQYFNIDDHEWWINKLTFDPEKGRVLVRNTSTDKLGKAGGKNYLQRSFQLNKMNPYTIKIDDQTKNAGRLVKGRVIRIGVYHHERLVAQTKNGKKASNLTSVYFAIPQHYEDSVASYSDTIAAKFEKAILLSTKLYPANRYAHDRKVIWDQLQDQFRYDNGYWLITKSLPNVLEILDYDKEEDLKRIGYLRFIDNDQRLELTWITDDSPSISIPIKINNTENHVIGSESQGFRMEFINQNELLIYDQGASNTFLRDWDFDRRRAYYR